MESKIQHKLWKLANYDFFIMQYCPTMYNKVEGIGVFFLFQMLTVFASVIAAYKVFVTAYLIFGFLFAAIVTYLFYKWMKFLNKIHHNYPQTGVFASQFFINLILAFLLSVPFCLLLFEHQILFQLYLKTGKMTFKTFEQLWLKPYGLYESWFMENEGNIILFLCVSTLIVVAFIFIIPYFLILKNTKSSYTLVKRNYEQNFD